MQWNRTSPGTNCPGIQNSDIFQMDGWMGGEALARGSIAADSKGRLN
jgi:hypothetical protein